MKFMGPTTIHWNITNRCESFCMHCYSRYLPFTNELSTSDALNILDVLSYNSIFVLHFGGGEPLLRKDLDKLITKATNLGITVRLSTSGQKLSLEFAYSLKKAGLVEVFLSYDSLDPIVSQKMRGTPVALSIAENAIKNLNTAGISWSANLMLCSINASTLEKTIIHLLDSGAKCVQLRHFQPVQNADINSKLLLDSVLHKAIISQIVAKYNNKNVLISENLCACDYSSMAIDPLGKIHPCPFLQNEQGEDMTQNFSQIWSKISSQKHQCKRKNHE